MRSLIALSCRLREVPGEILKGCSLLARLSLHGNPLTLEQLRSSEGFRDFNARRCASADKQVEYHEGFPLSCTWKFKVSMQPLIVFRLPTVS